MNLDEVLVLVRGGGELASGAIRRLVLAGFPVLVLEQPEPTCIRRTVCFANAIYEGSWEVESLRAVRSENLDVARHRLRDGVVPLLIDPEGDLLERVRPTVLVDGRMMKRNTGTTSRQARVVIALGPGYEAPRDAHFVIETARGHDLGRVITQGSARADTGVPGEIGGVTAERVLRAPVSGRFRSTAELGEEVTAGQVIGEVGEVPVPAQVNGVVRGLLRDNLWVLEGQKLADIDPRSDPEFLYRVSDKANAVAGGVMEALFRGLRTTTQS